MRLRSAWLAVIGAVLFGAASCRGQVSDGADDDGGRAGEVSGGAWSASAGRAPVAGGSRSDAGTGSTLRAGAPTIGPGGAAGWSGGDVAPPECWQIGSCGGDSGELVADAGAGGSDD